VTKARRPPNAVGNDLIAEHIIEVPAWRTDLAWLLDGLDAFLVGARDVTVAAAIITANVGPGTRGLEHRRCPLGPGSARFEWWLDTPLGWRQLSRAELLRLERR
jgi:hypothetical protein